MHCFAAVRRLLRDIAPLMRKLEALFICVHNSGPQ